MPCWKSALHVLMGAVELIHVRPLAVDTMEACAWI
jgi:hypothetical protein